MNIWKASSVKHLACLEVHSHITLVVKRSAFRKISTFVEHHTITRATPTASSQGKHVSLRPIAKNKSCAAIRPAST